MTKSEFEEIKAFVGDDFQKEFFVSIKRSSTTPEYQLLLVNKPHDGQNARTKVYSIIFPEQDEQ